MGMHRPDGWEEINPKPIGESMACAFNREDMYRHGENCADAMLEALISDKNKYHRYYEDAIIFWEPYYYKILKGSWAFMPNKEG